MGLIIVIVFLSILLLIGSLIALTISLQRDKKTFQIQTEDPKDDLKIILVLLNTYSGASRKHMALAFVKSGITFMKGPFRNLINFSKEQLDALPTNGELDAAKIDLHIAELYAEIERLKTKKPS